MMLYGCSVDVYIVASNGFVFWIEWVYAKSFQDDPVFGR